ncbi:MAG: SDR family oxidoreductase [Pseudomonadota bacterium]
MNLELKDKVAIVGGASQGIGFGIARALAQEGASLVITARRAPALEEAAARLRAECGVQVLAVASDARSAADCKEVATKAFERFGGVDILVNNDGAPPLGPIQSFDDTAWENAFAQNMLSVIRMVREVVPSMRERGGGSIVNISALSAVQPIDGFALSVGTWAGLIGYAKTLSNELGPHGIRVNTILPGFIDTPRMQRAAISAGRPLDEVMKERVAQIPLGRIGTPEEIGAYAAFLASPRAGFMTGTAVQVDGGMLRAQR